MGIQGLLPTLKSVMHPAHIRDYAGKRAAVDTYSWLHKAAFSCSKDICEGRPNEKYAKLKIINRQFCSASLVKTSNKWINV